MNNIITANDLKIRGVSAINEATSDGNEAIITVRGKNQYVVIPVETYNHLRECELEAALYESKNDLENGNYITETVDEHIKRITSD